MIKLAVAIADTNALPSAFMTLLAFVYGGLRLLKCGVKAYITTTHTRDL